VQTWWEIDGKEWTASSTAALPMAAAARRGVPGGEGSARFAATEERMRRRRPNGALRAAKWPQLHARRARDASK
jgi:hypothetical protein